MAFHVIARVVFTVCWCGCVCDALSYGRPRPRVTTCGSRWSPRGMGSKSVGPVHTGPPLSHLGALLGALLGVTRGYAGEACFRDRCELRESGSRALRRLGLSQGGRSGRVAAAILVAPLGEACYTYHMTHENFVDAAIIALAAAAPSGTLWVDIVRDAYELADARARADQATRTVKVRPAGGRLTPEERSARHQNAMATVLAMVQAAPGQRYPGGMYELARLAACGRNAAVTALRVLESKRILKFGTHGGRKFVMLGEAAQDLQGPLP